MLDEVGRHPALERALDLTVALGALLLLTPLIVSIALAIKLDSRGPVFYRCRRVGRRGHQLRMLKFRKMRVTSAGPKLTAQDDDRFTRIGRFLARTKLDEIPQLFNVLTGSMSLVGPRPEDPSFVALRKKDYEQILQVRPGITGLTQLAYARESEIIDKEDPVGDYVRRLLPQKARLDRLYVARRSLAMDVRILWWTTINFVFNSEVAVNRSTGSLTSRRRRTQLVASPQADGA
jgi:lipopolysaccharide/colanic/teichoic acid biosynthesis glycosyltransferase